MTDKEMAEEYEENAGCVDIDDFGHKVYGSLDIEQAVADCIEKNRKRAEGTGDKL